MSNSILFLAAALGSSLVLGLLSMAAGWL